MCTAIEKPGVHCGALLPWVFVAIILFPLAYAQPQPTTRLEVTGIPTKPFRASHESVLVAMNLSFRLENVVCTTTARFAATITAVPQFTNGSANVSTLINPPTIDYPVTRGAYAASPGPVYFGIRPFSLLVRGTDVTNTTEARVEVKAHMPAYSGTACAGSAPIPSATDRGAFNLTYVPPAAGTSTPSAPLPVLPLMAALLVAAFARRTRGA